MAFCKNCGVSINDEDKYCNSCGHSQFYNETMKSMKKDKKTVSRIVYIIFMVLAISIGIYSYIHITNKIAIKAENQVTANSNNVEKKDEGVTSPDKLKLIPGAVSEAKSSNSKEISVDEAINMIKSKITLYEGNWLEYRKEERVIKKGTIPAELVGKDCYIIDILSPPDICDGSYYVDKFSGTIYNLCQGNWKKVG